MYVMNNSEEFAARSFIDGVLRGGGGGGWSNNRVGKGFSGDENWLI